MSSLQQYECLVVPGIVRAGRIHAFDADAGTLTLYDPIVPIEPVTVHVDRTFFVPRKIAPVIEVGGYAVFTGRGCTYCPKAHFEHGYTLKGSP